MNKRLKEPSTWAGVGVIAHAITMLFASRGGDAMAWTQLVAGVAAVAMPEGAPEERRAKGERRKVSVSNA